MLEKIKYNDREKINNFIKFSTLFFREYYSPIMPDNDISVLENFNKEEIISKEIKEKRYFDYLINYNNQNIGSVSFENTENTLNILQIYLLKKYRKQKLSHEIIKEIKEYAKNKNIKQIKINISETNKKVPKIFEKLGFSKHDFISRYIGDGIYLYENIYLFKL